MAEVWIGVGKDGNACTSEETLAQIESAMGYTLDIQEKGESFAWEDLNWTDNRAGLGKRSLMQCIVNDRRVRINQKTLMNGRPPYIILDVAGDSVVRFRYYEYDGQDGHILDIDIKKGG